MPNRTPQEYLMMAQHADRASLEAKSLAARKSWQPIAQEYRSIAAEQLKWQPAVQGSK